ncbi:phage holin family protein [Carboxylicivirga linearis]|uniref:Phage holin family protein n=1 Tax=Carboxylicivirga linearis TaxID=1628157 RepID=A0ABS5JVR4_9BACT|nr:phage holin family protein [Carboxylicivirga linearis]MBS2099000.1 phage holin family protein [Carboxylicivirga linearis]
MNKLSLKDNISELNGSVKDYMDARVQLAKVHLLEKTSKIGTYLITSITIMVTLLFCLLLLALAFSFWYGNMVQGLLISVAFFLILAFVIYILRIRLIGNQVVRNLASIILDDEDKN